MDQILAIAGGVAVALGLGVYLARQAKQNAKLQEEIRAQLARQDTISLPDLVTRLGMKDGLMARGKVMNAINPLVASNDVLVEEPPGTTAANRLSVLTFRLVKRDL